MFLAGVDCSENNLLTEQLNVRSFYDLPVLNNTLIHHQLKNFADVNISKAYFIDCEEETDFSLFETVGVTLSGLVKALTVLNGNAEILIFRNDVYFEWVDFDIQTVSIGDKIAAITGADEFCYAMLCSVNTLKSICNRNADVFDLFRNSEKYADYYVPTQGYTKILRNVKDYKKLLFDILNGATAFKPPYVAEGIFTSERIPKGDFSVIPPVYIGKSVQIESGSSVGPNAVLYDRTVISSDTRVKNSVLFDDVYISSGCYVEGSVCCRNSSVKRNSAVFSGSVIGENSLIGEDVTVENSSLIRKNVKFDNLLKSPLSNKLLRSFKDKFRGLSPDKAALLGTAVANVFKKPKILVAGDGEINSLSVKLAFLGGFIASGGECIDMGTSFFAQTFFGSRFCESEYSVFFSGKNGGTDIEIFYSDGTPLKKSDCCNLFDFCNNGEFKETDAKACGSIRQIHGLDRMYIREIAAVFGDGIDFLPSVYCVNKFITKTVDVIFEKIAVKLDVNENFSAHINESASNLSIKYRDKLYLCGDLKRLVSFYAKNTEWDFNDGILKKLWNFDCVVLLFAVLNIIKNSGKNILDLMEALPDFYVDERVVSTAFTAGETARRLEELKNVSYNGERYKIFLKKGSVRVEPCSEEKKIKILCATENVGFSQELSDFFEVLFRDI